MTRLEDNDSCRIALIEGSLPEANRKARDVADRLARNFDCRTGMPEVIASVATPAGALLSGVPCGSGE